MKNQKAASNRQDWRRRQANARRPERPEGFGHGKHAMNGNKFRFVHVNWHKRIAKEMAQSPRVQEWLMSRRADFFLAK